jgi:hypothetical protein
MTKTKVKFEPRVVSCEFIKEAPTAPLRLVNCQVVALQRESAKKRKCAKMSPKRKTKPVQTKHQASK